MLVLLVLQWTLDDFVQSFWNVSFSVEQPFGESIKMQLTNFMEYVTVQQDEDPLYLFDADFASKTEAFSNDCGLPAIFNDDLLPLLGKPCACGCGSMDAVWV